MNIFKRMVASVALFAAAGFIATPVLAMPDVVVIGNSGLPVDSITADEAQTIFLGKGDTIKGGTRVTVVDQNEGAAVRSEFYQKVAGKNEQQLKAYWAKLVFTGQATPPKALADDKAVKAWVSSTSGAIGYISSGSVDSSVKVLLKP